MSMTTSVSGLRAASESLNIISNNIANANTIGYKAKNVQFADVYTSASSSGGVAVSRVETSFAQGNTVSTSSATDLAIKGKGFFVVRNSNGQNFYTRAGNFHTDKDGFLVSAQNLKVMGYATDEQGKVIKGQLVELKIKNADLPAKTSTEASLAANLDARSKVIDRAKKAFDADDTATYHSTTTTKVYDSLGNEQQLSAYYTKTGPNQWEVRYRSNGKDVPFADGSRVKSLSFDNTGKLPADTKLAIKHNFGNGSKEMELKIDLSSLTQFGNGFAVIKNSQNGFSAGNFHGISIAPDGAIIASYSNGQSQKQGYVPVATFANEDSLEAAGNTSWRSNVASGEPIVGLPGTGKAGTLKSRHRENSNVDMSKELVAMIVAQSAYQANTKAIASFKENTSMLLNTI